MLSSGRGSVRTSSWSRQSKEVEEVEAYIPSGNGADGLGPGQRVPRHAAEGLRGVARGHVADVELAAGEDGVAAAVLGEVGPGVKSMLESN